ncbi:MAG: replication-relaxation family protein [Phycisphaeraceae bacterium]|nr:replication-relaxation family protein [Phycisphaeraceae bacterium]
MDHHDREQRVLKHIAAFRVSLRAVIARLYFDDRNSACQNVLSRLKSRGWLMSHQSFTGTRLAYYQLGVRGVRHFRLPRNRAEHYDERALNTHLCILWWSCMSNTLRYRVEPDQVAAAIGCETLTGEHCMQPSDRGPRFVRVFVLGPDSDDQTALYRIKERMREAAATAVLCDWVRHSLYTFAILTDSPHRLRRLKEAVASDTFDPPGLVRVYQAPGIATLPKHLAMRASNQE